MLSVVRETMREPMFILLLAAGLLYLLLGDLQEGLILFGFVLMVLALVMTTPAISSFSASRRSMVVAIDAL